MSFSAFRNLRNLLYLIKRTERQKKAARLSNWRTDRVAFILRFGGNVATLAGQVGTISDKAGVSKGGDKPPFGTQPLEQRCSVLYLLPRLTGKMRVSHGGHTRFARQESGQVFANGNE